MSVSHSMMGHSWGVSGFVVMRDWIKWILAPLVLPGLMGCGDREEVREVIGKVKKRLEYHPVAKELDEFLTGKK